MNAETMNKAVKDINELVDGRDLDECMALMGRLIAQMDSRAVPFSNDDYTALVQAQGVMAAAKGLIA